MAISKTTIPRARKNPYTTRWNTLASKLSESFEDTPGAKEFFLESWHHIIHAYRKSKTKNYRNHVGFDRLDSTHLYPVLLEAEKLGKDGVAELWKEFLTDYSSRKVPFTKQYVDDALRLLGPKSVTLNGSVICDERLGKFYKNEDALQYAIDNDLFEKNEVPNWDIVSKNFLNKNFRYISDISNCWGRSGNMKCLQRAKNIDHKIIMDNVDIIEWDVLEYALPDECIMELQFRGILERVVKKATYYAKK